MPLQSLSGRLAIVDDHELFAHSLKVWLEKYSKIHVSVFSNAIDLLGSLDHEVPDIILMDIEMPGMNGFEATRTVHALYPDIRIIAITIFDDGLTVQRMVELGAIGYITKDVTLKEFSGALASILDGHGYIGSTAAHNYATHAMMPMKKAVTDRNVRFSDREMEIIPLIAAGKTNKEIGGTLHLSARTIEAHKRKIMLKMGVQRSTEIVTYAHQHRLI